MITLEAFGKIWDCVLERAAYGNGRVALQLNDAYDGQPIARATVNLVDIALDKDEVALNHDFAQDIENALVKADIIWPHHRTVRAEGSWVDFRICRLTGR